MLIAALLASTVAATWPPLTYGSTLLPPTGARPSILPLRIHTRGGGPRVLTSSSHVNMLGLGARSGILPLRSHTRGGGPRVLTSSSHTKSSRVNMLGTGAWGAERLVTLFKVDGSQCGEAHVRSEFVPFAQQFAGLQMGDCASIGYTKSFAKQTLNVPVVGTISIALFTS
ncbi:hypothetical protein T492DRAFT_1029297 [Pavlovales sp. CCMP2436]|nr:hypothetical protein T492DRAFT_1029297 [Pavlovales sp. CCMP2436]|mmetsp:Transcript_31765/g.79291  ORF Transcript_31765/g.79291 Transcript_31765/m.79291 type:complete len:170 (-) Transcript_31765:310-819(-)